MCLNIQITQYAVAYLRFNYYFRVSLKIFFQVTGSPMGSDPGSFTANLFLYFYERKWINEPKKTDLSQT